MTGKTKWELLAPLPFYHSSRPNVVAYDYHNKDWSLRLSDTTTRSSVLTTISTSRLKPQHHLDTQHIYTKKDVTNRTNNIQPYW